MTVQTLTLIFSLLTVLANLFVLAMLGLWLLGRWSKGASAALQRANAALAPSALWYAWIVALVTMLGSLYYSDVVHFTPCTLCWYQRIALYPMVVILLVAALRKDGQVWRYVVPVLAIGMLVSVYHYQLEWFPDQGSIACSKDVPCSAVWFREFGYITLAFMALSSAATQITLVLIARTRAPRIEHTEDD